MLDGFLVAFSPLLFEYDLHRSFCVLHYGCLDFDRLWGYRRVATNGVFARTNLVDLGKSEDVAYFNVLEAGDSKEVSGCEEVFPACDRRDDVLRWLRADEGECGCGVGRRYGLGV